MYILALSSHPLLTHHLRTNSLKNLEALAEKILSDCDAHSSLLDHLEGRVKEFESNCTSLPAQEAARLAGEIQRELKVRGKEVNGIGRESDTVSLTLCTHIALGYKGLTCLCAWV